MDAFFVNSLTIIDVKTDIIFSSLIQSTFHKIISHKLQNVSLTHTLPPPECLSVCESARGGNVLK